MSITFHSFVYNRQTSNCVCVYVCVWESFHWAIIFFKSTQSEYE
jgi:hypothetical protein